MALNQRMNRNQSLDRDTMSQLQDMLLKYDPFVPLYKQAAERLGNKVSHWMCESGLHIIVLGGI